MLHYTFTYINIHMFSYHSGRKHISTNAQVAKFNFRNPREKFLCHVNGCVLVQCWKSIREVKSN